MDGSSGAGHHLLEMAARAPDSRIVVDLPDDGSFGAYRQETLHAARRGDDTFELFNVPALANGIHVHDVVRCRITPDGLPRFEEVVEASGWGTLHIIVRQEQGTVSGLERLISVLRDMGALVEHGLGVVAVGLPPGTEPDVVLALMNPAAERGELVFELEI